MSALGPLHRYFRAEKQAALVCAALGLVALSIAAGLRRAGDPFGNMALPVGMMALLQVTVGGALAWRTGPQVDRLLVGLERTPARAKADELARMARVHASFRLAESAELILIAAALVLAVWLRARPPLMAMGLAILVQATVLLALDLFAERRAHRYARWLRALPV